MKQNRTRISQAAPHPNAVVENVLEIGLISATCNYQSRSCIHRNRPAAMSPPAVSLFDIWPAI